MYIMLCAKYGMGQSMDYPAQTVDQHIVQAIHRLNTSPNFFIGMG